jgi:hypothetical protein
MQMGRVDSARTLVIFLAQEPEMVAAGRPFRVLAP